MYYCIGMSRGRAGQVKKGLFPIIRKQPRINFGAEEKTRTSTGMRPLDPEPSASTNSATSATVMNMLIDSFFVKTFLTFEVKNSAKM
jgi:hypothetical protein